MKTDSAVKAKRVVPQFESEADEAQWWFDNKDLIEQDFIDAAEAGAFRHGRMRLRYAVAPAEHAVITLDPADAKLAHELAATRGEPYEEYVRKVMHRALELEKTA